MDEVKVLAAERRRRILALVWHQELTAGAIAAEFDVSWPAISQHLRILLDAGFVTQRREANRRYYRAVPEALGALRGLIEQQWREQLSELKDLAEAEHGPVGDHEPDDQTPNTEE